MNHWVKAECISSGFAILPAFLSKETIDNRPVEDSGCVVVSRSYQPWRRLHSRDQLAKAEWIGCREYKGIHQAKATRQQDHASEGAWQEAETCWELKFRVREDNRMTRERGQKTEKCRQRRPNSWARWGYKQCPFSRRLHTQCPGNTTLPVRSQELGQEEAQLLSLWLYLQAVDMPMWMGRGPGCYPEW